MTYVNPRFNRSSALAFAGVFLMLSMICPPASAESMLEGRVTTRPNADGLYDLRVQVWDHATGQPRLVQTVDIPKVQVRAGRFQVHLDDYLVAGSEIQIAFKIQSREFETFEAYRPAELLRFKPT